MLLFLSLETLVPFLDFDFSLEGVFVNNLNGGRDFDHYHYVNAPWEAHYARAWATVRLPLSSALAALQRLLHVAPHDLDLLFKAVAGILAVVGSFSACAPLWREPDRRRGAKLMFAAASLFPALYLYARGGGLFFLLSYALFWIVLTCVWHYFETKSRWALYLAGLCAALYAHNLYPPALVLLLVAAALLPTSRHGTRAWRDSQVYLAVLLAVGTYLTISGAVASTFFDSREQYLDMQRAFFSYRNVVFDWSDDATRPDFLGRVLKLWHQHVTFARDSLSGGGRPDQVWTLGATHIGYLLAWALTVLGMWESWRQRDRFALLYGWVIAMSYAVFLLASVPEGRYLLPVVPAYMYFFLQGLKCCLPQPDRWALVGACCVIAFGLETSFRSFGAYQDFVYERWAKKEGMKELALQLPAQNDVAEFVNYPEKLQPYDWNYLALVADGRLRQLSFEQLLEDSTAADRRYAVVRGPDPARVEKLETTGFTLVASYRAVASGRRYRLYMR